MAGYQIILKAKWMTTWDCLDIESHRNAADMFHHIGQPIMAGIMTVVDIYMKYMYNGNRRIRKNM